MLDSIPDETTPELQLEAQRDESGPPPRPTAIGQMDPDESLRSWPVTQLQFLQITETHSPAQSRFVGPIYDLTQNVLTALHSQRSTISFLLLGSPLNRTFSVGITQTTASTGHADSQLRKLLQNIFSPNQFSDWQDREPEKIKSLIRPLSSHAGLVTNIRMNLKENQQLNFPQKIARELTGKKYGLLVLAIPIPLTRVVREEESLTDLILRRRDGSLGPNRGLFSADLEEHYKNVQLGRKAGMWLTGIYYFAKSRDVVSAIESSLASESYETMDFERPTELSPHLCDLGLIRNKRPTEIFQELLEYRYLSPLNSQNLANWIHFPP